MLNLSYAWANGSDAVFFGTPGTVTITTTNPNFSANSVTFAVSGYTITSNTLSLNYNPVQALSIQSVTGGGVIDTLGYNATINSLIASNVGVAKFGSGSLTLTAASNFAGGTTVRAGNVVLSGPSGAVAGNASLLGTGVLVLDNTGVVGNNNASRLGDAASVTLWGGGVNLLGNASASSSETVGAMQFGLGNTGGGSTITAANGSAGVTSTQLTFSQITTTNRARQTINFVGTGGTLGSSGNNPRIKFTAAPGLTNSVISNSNGNSALGWATVNGTDFATHGANGVAAVSTTAFPASTSPTANALLSGNGNTAASASAFQLNTLKMSAASGGPYTLDINGAGNLDTVGYLLTGASDFTISSSGGGKIAGSDTRYFHVDTGRTLTVSANMGGNTNAIVKAGAGVLALTNTGNSATANTLTLNNGVVRVNATQTSRPGGPIEMRGGVLEVDLTGAAANTNLNLTLGTANGNVNWGAGGGGAFSAYSSGADSNTLTVRLNAGATLTWGVTPYFVGDGQPMAFGSAASNRTVILNNAINLNSMWREMRVDGGTVQLNGGVSSTYLGALDKTGPGTLYISSAVSLETLRVKSGTLRAAGYEGVTTLIVDGGELNIYEPVYGIQTAKQVILSSGSITSNASDKLSVLTSMQMESGTINGNMYPAALTKTTAGTVTITGAILSEAALNSGTAGDLNAGTVVLNHGSLRAYYNPPFNINDTATLTGDGTAGRLNVNAGGTLAPGMGVGVLATGNQVWNSGGNLNWQVADAAAAAGTGFDQLTISGSLNLASSTGFKVNLWSLSNAANQTSGNAVNFNSAVSQAWTLAAPTAGITGSPAGIVVNTAATNGTGGFTNALDGGHFHLVLNGTGGNTLQLKFDPAGVALALVHETADLGRVMKGQTPTFTSSILNLGATPANFTGTVSNDGATGTSGGTVPDSGFTNITLTLNNDANGTATTGIKSYAYTVVNTSNAADNSTKIMNLAVTVLADRVVTATGIHLGRVIKGAAVSGSSTLTTTEDDNNATRVHVTLNPTATDGVKVATGSGFDFNSATSTGSRTLSGAFATSGVKNIDFTMPSTTLEPAGLLAGQFLIPVVVNVQATALNNRVVSATSLALGRVMVGAALSGTSSLTTTLDDNNATRINVATTSAASSGISITDGSGTLFDSATATGTRTLGGAFTTTGSKNINLALTTTSAEPGGTLTGQTLSNVNVNVTATALANRVVTATGLNKGRVMVGAALAGTSNLTTTLADTSATRVNVATTSAATDGINITGGTGTLFNASTSTGTRTLGGAFATPGVKNVNLVLTTTSAETGGPLAGESPINVNVNVLATALTNRVVTASGVNLGRVLVGLPVSGASNLTTTLDDNNATRVNVATTSATNDGIGVTGGSGTLFNSAAATGTRTLGGAFATSGIKSANLILTTTSGESGGPLAGETPIDVTIAYTADVSQPASVSVVGGNAIHISNAITSDGGQRAAARLKTMSFLSGDDVMRFLDLTPGAAGTGTVVAAGEVVDASPSFLGNPFNGKYKATYALGLEHDDQAILGTAANDLGTFAVTITAKVAGKSGHQSSSLPAGETLEGLSTSSGTATDTLAMFLDGTLSIDRTISASWRPAVPGEGASNTDLLGDVLVLDGLAATPGEELFVLQMTAASPIDPQAAAAGSVYLAWHNGQGQWVNAVEGNAGFTTVGDPILRAYDAGLGDFSAGNWGVDLASNSVWAVLNHNSEYSIFETSTPEPTTLALLGSAVLLFGIRRKRCQMRDVV